MPMVEGGGLAYGWYLAAAAADNEDVDPPPDNTDGDVDDPNDDVEDGAEAGENSDRGLRSGSEEADMLVCVFKCSRSSSLFPNRLPQ